MHTWRERLAKIKAGTIVILKAAPTYLTGAAVVLTVFHEEIAGLLPESQETLGSYVTLVVAWLGAATQIIRRVTPVAPAERGILEQ